MTPADLLADKTDKGRLLALFFALAYKPGQAYSQRMAEGLDRELSEPSGDAEEHALMQLEARLRRQADEFFYVPLSTSEDDFKRFMLILERWHFVNREGSRMISEKKNIARSFDFFQKIVVTARPGVWEEYGKDGVVRGILDLRPGVLSHQALRELDQHRRDMERDAHNFSKRLESNDADRMKARGFPYSNSFPEYLRFLQNNFDSMHIAGFRISLADILSILIPYPVPIEKLHKGHTYVVGRSGSGKSELLKGLCFRLGARYVVLDPHGDLADEVSRFDHTNPPRIVPHERRTVINPFDIEDKSEANRELVAQEITDLMGELVEDSGMSRLMTTIIFPIIYTLLKLPYADFKMLTDCINPNAGKSRLKSLRHLVEPHHRAIWNELEADTYDTSKQSVFNRLQSLLNYRLVMQTLCGRDDFARFIEKPLNGGYGGVIVSLPIPIIGEAVAVTLGRFFMTRMQIWAKRRQNIPKGDREPVVFLVDEFHNFMSKATAATLDQYGRKFGLYMVLAHQHIQQLTDREVRGSVLANTVNKIAGMSNTETRQAVAKEMGIEADELDGLRPGHFWARFGGEEPFRFYARMETRYRARRSSHLETANGEEVLDGWDGIDQEQDTPQGDTPRQPPKGGYTPKFDI